MEKNKVNVIEKTEEMTVFGLWLNSNDKSVSRDIANLSEEYYDVVGRKSGEVLPFFILNKDYNEETRNFALFIGGLLENSKLDRVVLPQGYYGMMAIKPKLGFLWGLSIGQAKRYFYIKWLPKSNYEGLNFEYEYHSEKSVSKKPEIEIYFALEKENDR